MLLELIKLASEFGVSFAVVCAAIFIIYRIIKADKGTDQPVVTSENYVTVSGDYTYDLKYHPFFANTQYTLLMEIPSLQLIKDKPVKQQMFRDILRIELQTIIDTCYEIVDIDTSSWSAERWESEMKSKTNKMLSMFSKRVLDEGIPDLALAKYNKWHAPAITELLNSIVVIGGKTAYSDNIARTNTLFLVMQLLIVTSIADAEKSIKELNGEIGGQLYKNAIIEH